jgi:hypothetical protein
VHVNADDLGFYNGSDSEEDNEDDDNDNEEEKKEIITSSLNMDNKFLKDDFALLSSLCS